MLCFATYACRLQNSKLSNRLETYRYAARLLLKTDPTHQLSPVRTPRRQCYRSSTYISIYLDWEKRLALNRVPCVGVRVFEPRVDPIKNLTWVSLRHTWWWTTPNLILGSRNWIDFIYYTVFWTTRYDEWLSINANASRPTWPGGRWIVQWTLTPEPKAPRHSGKGR